MNTDRQRGFSLVSALFVVVVISGAAAFMLSLVGAQRQTTVLGVGGARAFYAARSGIEWAVARIVADATTCPAATFALSEGSLSGFTVTVTCALTGHHQGGVETHVFAVTASASRGSFGDLDYVSRRLEATVTAQP